MLSVLSNRTYRNLFAAQVVALVGTGLATAALLTVVSFPVLFGGIVIGFFASALLVLSVTLPWPKPDTKHDVWTRITRGTRIY